MLFTITMLSSLELLILTVWLRGVLPSFSRVECHHFYTVIDHNLRSRQSLVYFACQWNILHTLLTASIPQYVFSLADQQLRSYESVTHFYTLNMAHRLLATPRKHSFRDVSCLISSSMNWLVSPCLQHSDTSVHVTALRISVACDCDIAPCKCSWRMQNRLKLVLA